MDKQPKKILLIGMGSAGINSLILADMREKYGDNIILVSAEEAKEQGLTMEDFENVPTMKITSPSIPILGQYDLSGPKKSGKERRRQRRK